MSRLETKFVNEIAGNFFVPAYQRGYRWGQSEVRRLLEDVYNLSKYTERHGYCLQPIVVRNLSDNHFELIDGQQRLTTIFLVYKYMFEEGGRFFGEPKFSLDYETRKGSKHFLANINPDLRNDNIDYCFIADAYEYIKAWFAENGELSVTMPKLKTLFADNVKIIWYEVDETENATAMFTRLNIGKIPLTSAELVKAMFLSRDNPNMDRRRQDEIALQWDNLEKDLHKDSLWYFLTNNSASKYQTRIDLVLDLMSGKKIGGKDKYATFFYFDELKRRGEDLNDVWQSIVRNFLLLRDWYENHDFYHKIGYLIAADYKSLADIYVEAKGKSKREFSARLNELIKASVRLRGDENYSDWNYNEDAERIRRLLLLFNVESVRQNGEQSQWFPFDKYKFGGNGKVSWSLEHIHAVNSQDRGNQKQWREWLRLHRASLENFPDENKNLLAEIDRLLALKNITSDSFLDLRREILKKLSPEGMNEEINDSIANLALLKCADNSALGNSVFDVKRNEIIKLDMAGAFIPFCTKMAFLKYYTKSEKNQIHFWSATDRRAYLQAINDVLKDFLTKPIEEG